MMRGSSGTGPSSNSKNRAAPRRGRCPNLSVSVLMCCVSFLGNMNDLAFLGLGENCP
jgi:hypothetical protein